MSLERRKRRWRLFWSDKQARNRRRKAVKRWGRGAFIFAALAAALYFSDKHIAHQHLPWRSLNPDAPIGLATKMQLTRVALSPSSSCEALALQSASLNSLPAPPKDGDGPCGWTVARLMYGTGGVTLSPGEAALQCPLALGQHIWLREIDTLAREQLSSGLAQVYHAGSYNCRRQRGNGSSAWSEHAFANAFDVTGFKLSDGRVISVLKDWDGKASDESVKRRKFLRDVRDAACDIFHVTLSPDFNAAHADHFHLDMGPYSSCR